MDKSIDSCLSAMDFIDGMNRLACNMYNVIDMTIIRIIWPVHEVHVKCIS